MMITVNIFSTCIVLETSHNKPVGQPNFQSLFSRSTEVLDNLPKVSGLEMGE